MRRKFSRGLFLGLSLLLLVMPAGAHHSFTAEFDSSKWYSVKGTITKIEWVNPHVYFFMDVKDDKGNVIPYSFESRPPGLLRTLGVIRSMFSTGDEVTMDAFVAKDGSKHLGYIKAVHFADGHTVIFSSDTADDTK